MAVLQSRQFNVVPEWCKSFSLHQVGAVCHTFATPKTYIKLHTVQLIPHVQGFIGVISIMVLALLYLRACRPLVYGFCSKKRCHLQPELGAGQFS